MYVNDTSRPIKVIRGFQVAWSKASHIVHPQGPLLLPQSLRDDRHSGMTRCCGVKSIGLRLGPDENHLISNFYVRFSAHASIDFTISPIFALP